MPQSAAGVGFVQSYGADGAELLFISQGETQGRVTVVIRNSPDAPARPSRSNGPADARDFLYSVVIPVFNSERIVATTIDHTLAVFRDAGLRLKIRTGGVRADAAGARGGRASSPGAAKWPPSGNPLIVSSAICGRCSMRRASSFFMRSFMVAEVNRCTQCV